MAKERYCMPDPTVAMTNEVIQREVPYGSRVIDLGCGDGRLLQDLQTDHGCRIQGVEIDPHAFRSSLGRGVPVINANLDEGLPHIPDDTFDVAVLSQTLHQVRTPSLLLNEMLRVARKAIVVVPNFGHWRVRLQVLWYGSAPVTSSLPYQWYDTPNLHVSSMHDFRTLCKEQSIQILKKLPIIKGHAVNHAWIPNLRAESAMYVIHRTE